MLAKKYRLPIQSVLNKSGRTFRSRCFLLKLFYSKIEFNRFGVIISKKIDKRAAKRNWLKRIVLDSAKEYIRPPADEQKYDILIIPSPITAKMEKADIIKELKELFQKIIK